MNDEDALSVNALQSICTLDTKLLTIKIAGAGQGTHAGTQDSLAHSRCDSPLISPPSSAFVSALQSPYISPRATVLTNSNQAPAAAVAAALSPPASYSSSLSDDTPSTSYTPPSEKYDFSDDPTNTKLKIVTCMPGSEAAPRISFSFPVPRISLTKGPVSPAGKAKLRSCDVYIGFHGENPNLIRFCKWLKSELEFQGIACFIADRAKYGDNQSHDTADRVICSVAFGVVVVSSCSLVNHLSLEEIRFFSQKKNLIPLFFNTDFDEITSLVEPDSDSKECQEAMDGLKKFHEFRLEANEGNWRSCVSKTAETLKGKLGRQSVAEKELELLEEIPFPRNRHFVGREKEMMEIEYALFGCGSYLEQKSGDLADEESQGDTVEGEKCIGSELGGCQEPNLEAWIEPAIGKNAVRRSKYRRSKSGKYKSSGSSVVCINGTPGIGKTELALEFAHRFSQRYKMVLWVGGEALYFRQNVLNMSLSMNLDVTADEEKEKGRIRSFDEQESEAFKRVKREIFRDMPYLLIIDNLESERDWWDGKDLHDLIPRNTAGAHVIITTRLSRVMNYDTIQLQPLPVCDAMGLISGRRKKEYPAGEAEFLRRFYEKLCGSSFGLSVVSSLLSELEISPSSLFDTIDSIQLDEVTGCLRFSTSDQQFCRNSPFLMKVMSFCMAVLQQGNGNRKLLSSRMLQAGAWFAPSPIPANLLAAAANSMPSTKIKLRIWTKCWKLALPCCLDYLKGHSWNTEEDSALLLVKFGLARKVNKHPGCWIQFHAITQVFGKRKDGVIGVKAAVQGVRKTSNLVACSDHLWASTFLVFGVKSEPAMVPLKAIEMVLFIKKIALPLAIKTFTNFSRCNSALELLKVCTDTLDEIETSFASEIQGNNSICWKKKLQSNQKMDEYVWQEVTLLKAVLLESRAKLLLRGGHFDSGEELCRMCISIRTVMLGHNHAQTLAAQETLAKIVRMRSKM